MIKKIKIILLSTLIFGLVGCSPIQVNIEEIVLNSFSMPLTAGTNHSKSYFRYYLPLDANLRKSTETSSLISFHESLILMQLNVSAIVTKQYYEDSEYNDLLTIPEGYESLQGQYQDNNGQGHTYYLAYKLVENNYVLVLYDDYVQLTSVAPISNVDLILTNMITILRSVEVDEQMVVDTFSNKEIIDYKPITEDFFEVAIPETGTLKDMYNRLNPDEPIEDEGE